MRIRVLALCEGTYPYYRGGVSTWCHNLFSDLKDFDFYIFTVVGNPHISPKYRLPPNVKEMRTMPLWGTERIEEFDDTPAPIYMKRVLDTKRRIVEEEFIPPFKIILKEVMVGGRDLERLGGALHTLHHFSQRYDFKQAFKDPSTWEAFLEIMGGDPLYRNMKVLELINICRTIQHFLRVVTVRAPRVDICHVSAAAFTGILGIIQKIEYGTPYLLTEHGVYFRERILDLIGVKTSVSARIFWNNFYSAIVRANFFYADKIAPTSNFNMMWEERLGVPEEKVETIYNGVDIGKFTPRDEAIQEEGPATIVAVARIDKLKDIVNMVEAMKYVKEKKPEVKCRIFGPISDPDYYRLCLKTRERLNLSDAVVFEGPTMEPEKEMAKATVFVQPSLSEGFPYTVIEAMACGRPVVATDVGGVKEAIGDSGLLARARSPKELASKILKLLDHPELQRELSLKARMRVERLFSYKKFLEEYRRLYLELLTGKALLAQPLLTKAAAR
jgi:glycosyltransferase involved in cell wall biosynthesis